MTIPRKKTSLTVQSTLKHRQKLDYGSYPDSKVMGFWPFATPLPYQTAFQGRRSASRSQLAEPAAPHSASPVLDWENQASSNPMFPAELRPLKVCKAALPAVRLRVFRTFTVRQCCWGSLVLDEALHVSDVLSAALALVKTRKEPGS